MTDLERALQAGGVDITDHPQPAPRTARPSGYPVPKSMSASDVDLGIESPPQEEGAMSRIMRGTMMGAPPERPSMFDVKPSQEEIQAGLDFTRTHGRPMDPMEADPIAQGVVLSATLGPLGRAAYNAVAPAIGSLPAGIGIGAGEGYLGSKMTGGDATTGALFGAMFGGLGVGGAKPSSAAISKNNTQVIKDINRGTTKAPGKLANDVRYRSGDLGDVLSELPDTRKSVVTNARANPGAAGKDVKGALRDLTAENDAVFDAIQSQHGGVPLDGIAGRLTQLESKLNQQGRGVAADAAARFRDDLVNRYGVGGTAGVRLTSEQIRNIRNDIGDLAFPGGGAQPKGARAALGDIYNEVNGAIEDVAGMTQGVDAAAFKARNRQISSLIPVQKALGSRVAATADLEPSMFGRIKNAASNATTRLNRAARYGAEQRGADNPGLMLSPASVAAQYLLNGGNE